MNKRSGQWKLILRILFIFDAELEWHMNRMFTTHACACACASTSQVASLICSLPLSIQHARERELWPSVLLVEPWCSSAQEDEGDTRQLLQGAPEQDRCTVSRNGREDGAGGGSNTQDIPPKVPQVCMWSVLVCSTAFNDLLLKFYYMYTCIWLQ